MTLLTTKKLKSATAALVSASLIISASLTPAAAQSFRAGAVSEAGSAVRVSVPQTSVTGMPTLPASALGSATLNPTLAPAAAPSALALPAPISAAAAKNDGAPVNPEGAKTPAPAKPVVTEGDAGPRWVSPNPSKPAPKTASDSGPRWVKPAQKSAADAGPRWVGPAPKGIRATLAKFLPFLAKTGAETFDGSVSGRGDVAGGASSVAGKVSKALPGLKPSARVAGIVENHSIPTPEAARRVGEIRSTPLWAKVVAPLAAIGAVAVAISVGAVPVLTLAAGLVVSVLAHEVAHIAVLHRLGDQTAEHAHSHSLNPFKHIDAVKTVIVPAVSMIVSSLLLPFPILIGAGKPVDADFNNLRSPFGGPRSARNALWVAAAGPLTNLAIAGLAFAAASLLPVGGTLALVAAGLWKMNLALAVFNMLPLPQLDGGKILAAVLPERFYAKWVYNPRVERGYQGVFRRLYEGPSNVLTWVADFLGVRTQKGVNTLANVVTFTALAAFYAAAYFHLSLAIPLLFLALPCSYDYWCIREKVRSEAAVQDLMEIMAQWSTVIVQISEDMGLDSEVSAYETEHAMKNALETLVDEMMAKEEFRGLSDEQKLEALMKAYPDKAAEFLKEKAMTEDSLEKIKAVLQDPRNQPFYDRIKKWFGEHEIFKRWDNKEAQGKLKGAMEQADKKQGSGGRLPAFVMLGALGLGGGFTGMFPDWAPLIAAAFGAVGIFGMLGTIGGGDQTPVDPMSKVRSTETLSRYVISVDMHENANAADVERVFQGLEYNATAPSQGYYRVEIANRTDGALVARRIARDAAVVRVSVNPELYEQMNLPVPEPVSSQNAQVRNGSADSDPFSNPVWTEKIKLNNGYPLKRVRVVFHNPSAARQEFRRVPGTGKEMKGASAFETNLRTPAEAAEFARAIADGIAVKSVVVSAAVHNLLLSRNRTAPAPAPEPDREPAAEPNPDQNELPFERTPSNEDPAPVETPEAQAPAAETPAPEPVAETPAPPPAPVLPEKVSSHGKEDWSTTLVKATFFQAPTGDEVAALSRELGAESYVLDGVEAQFHLPTLAKSADAAKALSADARISAAKIHDNVEALLLQREQPYPEAASYDHQRTLLVQFAPETTDEFIKEYGEVRRLKLVRLNYRGADRLTAFEVPAPADFPVTARMLGEELGATHLPVNSIRALVERPEVVIPEAQAPAAVEEKAPEAAVIPRRDPAQAWVEYLQNVTLSDGKSKLTDKQVQLIAFFMKPIAKSPEDQRAPVVARTEEIKRALPIITSPRGMRNSIILVGEAGVGKTAIAEGLAEMAEQAEHAALTGESSHLDFARLKGRWLVELDINEVLASEDPVKTLSAILKLLPLLNEKDPSAGNKVIVLMDEIQKFFLDPQGTKIANILKNPLRNGEVSVIAGTTSKEYKTYVEKDDAFRRRLEKIDVEEFTVEKTIRVLRAMKEWFQKLHKAIIPDQALVDAAKLTDQFDKTNFNPDKAIKAVQDAAELSRPENLRAAVALDIRETWGELAVSVNEARQLLLDKGIASTLALPAEHWNRIAELVQRAADLYKENAGIADGRGKVSTDVVKRVIAQKTGIASGQLNLGEEDAARYNAMEEKIGERVVNQDPALHAIANAIRRNKAGLSNPNRPMGKFLLTGPTGVGKTYLAKELARFLFNDPTAMVRFDMSEFMEEHAAMRLVGAPPSYVGYGEGGQLTEAVRKKPYSVVLFDEVEKAHPKVFDMLLQILDDGRLTDGEGRTIDFKNTVIIMTSNAGMSGVDGEKYAKLMAKIEAHNAAVAAGTAVELDKPLPTLAEVEAAWDAEIDAMVADSLKTRFRPEFLNRLDEDPNSKNKWIRVNRLRQKDVKKIASIQLDEFKHLLADRHDTEFFYDQSVVEFLTVEGFSPLYGARPMTAAIEKHIVDPLAKWILQEAAEGRKDARGGRITVTVKDGAIQFKAEPKPIKDVVKLTVQGAAESVAAETFRLLETLVSEGQGEEPSEAVFDAMMRRAAPKAAPDQAQAETKKERTRAFFAPGATLKLASAPAAAEHNNAKKKDAAMRGAIAAGIEKAKAAGWGTEAAGLLETPADGQGEGWLKQLVKLSKEQATRAGSEAPVTLNVEAGADVLRVAVAGSYAMSDDEIRSLMMHFTGVPPETYKAAQNKVDNLNLTAKLLWDHNLLDLYRRASVIPGARMGFKTGAEGTQIWLEIRRETGPPALEESPKAAASASDGPKFAGTPHQQREMEKLRGLLLRVVDQSKMSENQRDGHSIRIAAAEGYASLAQPSDAAIAREWIKTKGWAGAVVVTETKTQYGGTTKTADAEVGANWPLALTAALILERFGGAEDVELLENMARRITGTSHYEVPVHGALVSALSSIYMRLGLKTVREAASRAAQITEGRTTDITNAVKRALGTVGMPADASEAKQDADAHLAMTKRLGKTAELIRVFRDTTFWGTNSETAVREAALKLAAETGTPDDLNRLKNMMRTQTGYSTTAFETARAWAAISAREGLTGGLGDAMKRYLDARGVKDYSLGSTWAFLYAMVETAKLAGGAGELAALEELMDAPPNDIASVNEQAYFNSPEAWARSLVRSGKFEEYARPQGLTPEGAPRPSKLQEMLVNQTRPMRAAAALRALALARDPNFSKAPIAATGPLPELRPDSGTWNPPPSSSGSGVQRPSNPRFNGPDEIW